MSSNAVATDRKAVMRDKRAQGIAAMGLVTRENDRFRVLTPTLRGRKQSYEVWRDETGKVRCSCLEFEEQVTADPGFRCEHILAVKHSLLARNTEAVTKQQPVEEKAEEIKLPAETTAPDAAPNTNANASEEQETVQPKRARRVERSEREANEAEDATLHSEEQKRATNIRSLAQHNDIEEQEMNRKKDTALEVQEITENGNEAVGSVVPFTNTLRALKQQVDPNFIKTREGWTDRQGNTHMVEYVEWHTVADILDRIAPTWQHAVRNVVQLGDIAVVTAAITIDGVTREGVGTGTSESEMGIKKAEHDALKRAAVKFGIARELYQRESEVIERQGSATQPGAMPRDPLAKSMADLVTPKQLGMIRALAREAGVDPEEECQSVLRCKTDELSKRAASSFIDHLKGLQQEAGAIRRAS
jgi:flagellar biosynthesis GTPase FlhF